MSIVTSKIILDTGHIIDSRFFRIEQEVKAGFGARIKLMDMNGDGYPEIVGENPDFSLRVYDIYAERGVW